MFLNIAREARIEWGVETFEKVKYTQQRREHEHGTETVSDYQCCVWERFSVQCVYSEL